MNDAPFPPRSTASSLFALQKVEGNPIKMTSSKSLSYSAMPSQLLLLLHMLQLELLQDRRMP